MRVVFSNGHETKVVEFTGDEVMRLSPNRIVLGEHAISLFLESMRAEGWFPTRTVAPERTDGVTFGKAKRGLVFG